VGNLAADGPPLIECAIPGALHLLAVARGPSAATSPDVAAEIRVVGERVRVVHWLFGEPFRVVAMTGRA
jgi:hypothetical protein